MANYLWSVSGGTINAGAGTNSISVTWNTPGTDTVRVNYSNSFGCSATIPVIYPVAVTAGTQPILSGPSTACAGTSGHQYTTQAGMSNYTWVVSSGGTILTGGTAIHNTVTVRWNTAGAQSVSVSFTNANGCTTNPTVYPVAVSPIPSPTLSGPASTCIQSSSNVYVTQPGMMSYSWGVSAGGAITSGGSNSNSITVSWNTLGNQMVSVNYTTSAGCSAIFPVTYPVFVYARPAPTLSGPSVACNGSSNSIYTTQTGMNGYTWSVTGGTIVSGGTVNSASATVQWNTAGPQTVSVNYNNSQGCPALVATSFPVTVNPQPTPILAGPNAICGGTSGNVYSTDPGYSNYVWAVSPGGTITSGGTATSTTATVSWNSGGNQYVQVNYKNSFGCMAGIPSTYSVTVFPRPVPTISGPDSACGGTSGHIYTSDPNMNLYVWAVSPGGIINSGGGSETISVSWNTAGMRNVSLTYVNQIGCTTATPTIYTVTVLPPPVPAITGPGIVCVGTSGHLYSTAAGMSNYQWTISSGGTITSGTTSNTVFVTWNTLGSQNIGVSYTNGIGCTSIGQAMKTVTVTTAPAPVIQGNVTPCANSGSYQYTTEPGMMAYQWSVSPGGIITSGTGTNSIQISWFGQGSQYVSVNYSSGGCAAAIPATLNISVQTGPGNPGIVTGPSGVCAGSSGNDYSTDSIANATSYLWNLPPGAMISSGAGTRHITLTFSSTAQSGNISVLGLNSCGSGPVSQPLGVTVTQKPTAAGPVMGLDSVAYGATGIPYEVDEISGASGYSWTFPGGATIVAGNNTRSVTVNFSGTAVSGSVKVLGNNSCGNGTPSPNFKLTITAPPVPPFITQAFDLLYSNHPIGNQWFLDGTAISGATGPVYQALEDGWYWTKVTRYGISDTSNHIFVVVTSLDEKPHQSILIYPVPNRGHFALSADWPVEEAVDLVLLNSMGVKVYQDLLRPTGKKVTCQISLPQLPSGVYSVKVVGKNKSIRGSFIITP